MGNKSSLFPFIPGTYKLVAKCLGQAENALTQIESGPAEEKAVAMAEALNASFEAYAEINRLRRLTQTWRLKPSGIAYRVSQKIGGLNRALQEFRNNPKALPKARKALKEAQEFMGILARALREKELLD